jgi:orotidine-5'-phosphate decarboxylase
VGLELFSAAGPEIVHHLRGAGKEVFLDLKFHDIPNTVAAAARVANKLGVKLTTVHAAAGARALRAAAEALREGKGSPSLPRPALLAVTVLTSLSAPELQEIVPSREELPERIVRLARLAWEAGCDGIVCAPTDLKFLRSAIGPEPLVVTPGIRPTAVQNDDQRRTMSPEAAFSAGADFLVVGRPITRAPDPQAAFQELNRELEP